MSFPSQQPATPFAAADGVTVQCWGQPYTGPDLLAFRSSKSSKFSFTYPVGYRSERRVHGQQCESSTTLSPCGERLLFSVRNLATGQLFVSTFTSRKPSSPTDPWYQYCLQHESETGSGQRISGPKFFGFSDERVVNVIRGMYRQSGSCGLQACKRKRAPRRRAATGAKPCAAASRADAHPSNVIAPPAEAPSPQQPHGTAPVNGSSAHEQQVPGQSRPLQNSETAHNAAAADLTGSDGKQRPGQIQLMHDGEPAHDAAAAELTSRVDQVQNASAGEAKCIDQREQQPLEPEAGASGGTKQAEAAAPEALRPVMAEASAAAVQDRQHQQQDRQQFAPPGASCECLQPTRATSEETDRSCSSLRENSATGSTTKGGRKRRANLLTTPWQRKKAKSNAASARAAVKGTLRTEVQQPSYATGLTVNYKNPQALQQHSVTATGLQGDAVPVQKKHGKAKDSSRHSHRAAEDEQAMEACGAQQAEHVAVQAQPAAAQAKPEPGRASANDTSKFELVADADAHPCWQPQQQQQQQHQRHSILGSCSTASPGERHLAHFQQHMVPQAVSQSQRHMPALCTGSKAERTGHHVKEETLAEAAGHQQAGQGVPSTIDSFRYVDCSAGYKWTPAQLRSLDAELLKRAADLKLQRKGLRQQLADIDEARLCIRQLQSQYHVSS